MDVIDAEARAKAADLVRRFRDGALTNDQLEDAWPENPSDRALAAVASMLWQFHDDLREHALVGQNAPTLEGEAALTRFAAFLDTDLPYGWSRVRFIGIGGLGPLVPLSLGLLWPLDRWIRARDRRDWERMSAEGDLEAWPFLRMADYRPA